MAITDHNSTLLHDHPEWTAKPDFKMPNWGEAVILVTMLFGGMFLTRSRDYQIFSREAHKYKSVLHIDPRNSAAGDGLLESDSDNDLEHKAPYAQGEYPPKHRSCCGLSTIKTPNTSRFRNHLHSRLFQKFPFLVEMFYWILNYLFYRMTSVLSNKLFAHTGIWQVAKSHAMLILDLEQVSLLRIFFPIHEIDVQRWFMDGHQDALTIMDRTYSLVHIPGTIA